MVHHLLEMLFSNATDFNEDIRINLVFSGWLLKEPLVRVSKPISFYDSSRWLFFTWLVFLRSSRLIR